LDRGCLDLHQPVDADALVTVVGRDCPENLSSSDALGASETHRNVSARIGGFRFTQPT
jgi:hypothetical protein